MKKIMLSITILTMLFTLLMTGMASAGNVIKDGKTYYYWATNEKGVAIYQFDAKTDDTSILCSLSDADIVPYDLQYHEGKIYLTAFDFTDYGSKLYQIDTQDPSLKSYNKNADTCLLLGGILYYRQNENIYSINISTGEKRTIGESAYIIGSIGNKLLYSLGAYYVPDNDKYVYDYKTEKSKALFIGDNYTEHDGYVYVDENNNLYRYVFNKEALTLDLREKLLNLDNNSRLIGVKDNDAYVSFHFYDDNMGSSTDILERMELSTGKRTQMHSRSSSDSDGEYYYYVDCGDYIWEYYEIGDGGGFEQKIKK